MKINILYEFRTGPWGGGNQFLKALKSEFVKNQVYENDPEKADVFLFNSFPFGEVHRFKQVYNLKTKNRFLIHRIDGPIFKIRNKDQEIDKIIYDFNNLWADGTIFQSNWSMKENHKQGIKKTKYITSLNNAPDSRIFNNRNRIVFNSNRKIRLIATSWSSNVNKGFEIYQHLERYLDFSKYSMTFVGKSPIEFKNIKWIKPVLSKKLAEILKEHDIYITASQNDPCSNSLIEALSCGLPAVVLNDGGHPELVKNGGELFDKKEQVIGKVEKVVESYDYYQRNIPEYSLETVARCYYEFAQKIFDDIQMGKYKPKQGDFFSKVNFYKVLYTILKWKTLNKMRSIWKR